MQAGAPTRGPEQRITASRLAWSVPALAASEQEDLPASEPKPRQRRRILDLFSKRRNVLTCLGELMLAMEVLLPGL